MPELPEVETIKRVIEPQIQGRMITKVAVRRPKVAAYPEADEFCRRLTGQTVSHMSRQGKLLISHLENKERIVLHLRMTGGLLLAPAQCPEEKYTHVVFSLDNGTELRFSDMRRFGRFWLLREEETDTCTGMDKLGLDPLAPACNAEYLSSHLSKRRKAIKECLLEQTIIAGIGNIYSDEILFTAGIYPARPANSLKQTEWERLAEAIPERISYFIEKNAITAEEYLETKGRDYRNTPFLQLYGHGGSPCPKCRETLCRMVIGGRSSVYCPVCQKDNSC